MIIELVNSKDGESIVNVELHSNPYSVGQTINLSVNNYHKDKWENVKSISKSFRVDKVEHFIRIDYSFKRTETVIASVEVSEIIETEM